MEEDIADYEEELAEIENTIVGYSGKYVWIGTEGAIKASKG